MRNRMKEKILWLIRWLYDQRHRVGTRVITGVLAVALIFTFVVLPVLADETEGEPDAVSEELLEQPEETPESEPEEEPAEAETEEELPEESGETETEEETDEAETEEEPQNPDNEETGEEEQTEETEETSPGEEDIVDKSENTEETDRTQNTSGNGKAGTATVNGSTRDGDTDTDTDNSLPEPQIDKDNSQLEDANWTYLASDGGTTLKVELSNYKLAYEVSYQWYCGDVEINNANQKSYRIDAGSDAGTYRYTCEITYRQDGSTSSVTINPVTITIDKKVPAMADFSWSSVPSTVYYTGTDQRTLLPVTTKSNIVGMGDITVWTINQVTNENVPFLAEGTYELWIQVAEGKNYKAVDEGMRLLNGANPVTVTIKRITTPSTAYTIDGKKGNGIEALNGMIAYLKKDASKDRVAIVPPNGYMIAVAREDGTDEDLTFSTELAFTETNTSQNVAPEKIILRRTSDGALTAPVSVKEYPFCVDLDEPTGQLSLTGGTLEETSDSRTRFFSENPTVEVTQIDDTGSSRDNIKCYMTAKKSTEKAPTFSATSWTQTTDLSVTNMTDYIVYAVLVDEAGNQSDVMCTDRILIDSTQPEIQCGSKAIKENHKYIADQKSFVVSDTYLRSVKVSQSGDEREYTYDKDFTGTSCEFTLKSPDANGASYTYTITAKDAAGNEEIWEIILQNPNNDVKVDPVELDVYYGYDAAALGVSLELVPVDDYNDGPAPTIDAVTPIAMDDGTSYFTYDKSTNKITPVSGLSAREDEYQAMFRVDYSGKETESTTTFTCRIRVKKVPLSVTYTGQKVYYHVNSSKVDFASHLEFTPVEAGVGFAPGEDPDYLIQHADTTGFVIPNIGTNQGNIIENEELTPSGGDAYNYEFRTYVSGTLMVADRRELDGFTTTDPVAKNDWYTSSSLALIAKDGYYISTDDGEMTFRAGTSIRVLPDGETQTGGKEISFYLMDADTEEISKEMTRTIKIDPSAPVFGDGEGIVVSDIWWKNILETITFGTFFNETKAVRISGSDDMSGIESIHYYLSPNSVGEADLMALEETGNCFTGWQEYDGGFDLEPEDIERVVICARLTNGAGLSSYITTDGLVFDNKIPEINVEDEGVYVAEEIQILISDHNLKSVKITDVTETPVTETVLEIETDENGYRTASMVINTSDWSAGESRTYTIIASDDAGNVTDRVFTIVKPIYGIVADKLSISERTYGYDKLPTAAVTWKNTPEANADATISEVELSDRVHFQVLEEDGEYAIAPQEGLAAGKYQTDVTLHYNEGKTAETTCSFSVNKATLSARYTGQSVYYHMIPDFDNTIVVTGFVNGDTPETAAGYEAPTITYTETADETAILVPKGGKADNYNFTYSEGILLVNRRAAEKGAKGQYQVSGTMSDSGWYRSDITITPSSGYVIALDEKGDKTKDSLTLTDDTDAGMQEFYLMNSQTGEIYEATDFEYKKDVVAPKVSGAADGGTYVVNSREITVEDEYLSSVTVNGSAQPVSGGQAKFSLSADQTSTLYVLAATDRAGNMTSATIVLQQPSELPVTEDGTAAEITTDAALSDPGTVKKAVQVETGAPATSITSTAKEVASAVLTDAEKLAVDSGSSAKIELSIKNVDSTVDQSDKELIIANLGDYTLGTYLDIELWKTVGNSDPKQVYSFNSPISVTVTVPTELRNQNSGTTRTYAILRVHNGSVALLKDTDSVANTVTFSTNRFSTYALVYRDTAANSGGSTGSGGSTSGSLALSSGSYLPAMGDSAPIALVSTILVVALAGIVLVVILRKRMNKNAE